MVNYHFGVNARSAFFCWLAGSQAPALIVIHKSGQARKAVIPAGMPESSAMDGNFPITQVPDSIYLATSSFMVAIAETSS